MACFTYGLVPSTPRSLGIMKKAARRHFLILALLGATVTALAPPAIAQADANATQAKRVVTLGGSVTEIVYALGQEARLVGNDISSIYPDAANQLPRVGYYRSVPIEGVAALRPDLVIASEQAGPPDVLARLAKLGIPVKTVSDRPSVDSLNQRIDEIAVALGTPAEGKQLTAEIAQSLQAVDALPASNARALLIMNRTGAPQGAGAGTAANLVLERAGLDNVLKTQKGYLPLSAEGLTTLAPEVIVVTQASLGASGGLDKIRALPGLAHTPAVKNNCIVVMDDLLALGTGPRFPLAIRELKETPCIAGLSRRAP